MANHGNNRCLSLMALKCCWIAAGFTCVDVAATCISHVYLPYSFNTGVQCHKYALHCSNKHDRYIFCNIRCTDRHKCASRTFLLWRNCTTSLATCPAWSDERHTAHHMCCQFTAHSAVWRYVALWHCAVGRGTVIVTAQLVMVREMTGYGRAKQSDLQSVGGLNKAVYRVWEG